MDGAVPSGATNAYLRNGNMANRGKEAACECDFSVTCDEELLTINLGEADHVTICLKDVHSDINIRLAPASSKATKLRLAIFLVLLTFIVCIHMQDVINTNNSMFVQHVRGADAKFRELTAVDLVAVDLVAVDLVLQESHLPNLQPLTTAQGAARGPR